MAISEAMLAQALLDYFKESAEGFRKFVRDRHDVDLVTWRGDKANRRLLLTLTRLGQGGEILAEHDYALRLERADRRAAE